MKKNRLLTLFSYRLAIKKVNILKILLFWKVSVHFTIICLSKALIFSPLNLIRMKQIKIKSILISIINHTHQHLRIIIILECVSVLFIQFSLKNVS